MAEFKLSVSRSGWVGFRAANTSAGCVTATTTTWCTSAVSLGMDVLFGATSASRFVVRWPKSGHAIRSVYDAGAKCWVVEFPTGYPVSRDIAQTNCLVIGSAVHITGGRWPEKARERFVKKVRAWGQMPFRVPIRGAVKKKARPPFRWVCLR